jgi:hypothetical protein
MVGRAGEEDIGSFTPKQHVEIESAALRYGIPRQLFQHCDADACE